MHLCISYMDCIRRLPRNVLYEIYGNMSVKELSPTLSVSRSVGESTLCYVRHVVDAILRPYSDDDGPDGLCAVLRSARAVVTGSNALALLLSISVSCERGTA